MAGDWIKMRGGLFNSPKLIAMSRALHAERAFRDWLTPGGGGPMNGQLVSDHALRCVTGALLCVTWSWSREFGKALPNGDCLLPKIELSDLDGIAGAPSIGDAMATVGWAEISDDPPGVILPKFFLEHNVPLTAAEKQRSYRARKRERETVTKALPSHGNKTVTREEKRREEKNNPLPPSFEFSFSTIKDALPLAFQGNRIEKAVEAVMASMAKRNDSPSLDPPMAAIAWIRLHGSEEELLESAKRFLANQHWKSLNNYARPKPDGKKQEGKLKFYEVPPKEPEHANSDE